MTLLDLLIKVTASDNASEAISSMTSTAIAKGQLMADAIKSAVKAAASAIQSFLTGAIGAFQTYEQQVGGIQTFFGDSAQQVIDDSKEAYKTAGMSANEYLTNVSSFAMSLVNSVAQRRRQVVNTDTATQSKALDTQVKDLQRALSKELSAQQKANSQAYRERQKALQSQIDAVSKANAQELKERQRALDAEYNATKKALDKEVSDYQKATEAKVKQINKEYVERIKLVDEDEYRRVKAIEAQIEAIESEGDAQERALKERQQAEKEASLRYAAQNAETAEEREKAEEELTDFLESVAVERANNERNERIEALKKQRDDVKEFASEERDRLKAEQSETVSTYKEQRSAILDAMRESNATMLTELKQHNSDELEAMRERNQQMVTDMRNAMSEELEAMQESQQAQIEAMRESQQAQLDAVRESVAAQKQAYADAANAGGEYIEATAEDQAEAARLAKIAMVDIADNANKMGTGMESLQWAYQGFAKQNFTMLDNLKLGFGGTKSEMERLLETAEQIKASEGEVVDYSIDSFADIVEAIHTVQKEYEVSGYSVSELEQKLKDQSLTEQELHRISQDMLSAKKGQYKTEEEAYAAVVEAYKSGSLEASDALILTGTTSYEASKTIEGSMNTAKAAWENWLISLADPEWNVEESTTALMESVGNAMALIIPRATTILETLFKYIEEHGPEMAKTLKESFMKALPDEWKTKLKDFEKVLDGVMEGIKVAGDILKGIGTVFGTVGGIFNEVGTRIGTELADLVSGFEGTENVGGTSMYNVGAAFRALGDVFSTIGKAIGDVVRDISNWWSNLTKGAEDTYKGVTEWFGSIPDKIWGFFTGIDLFQAGKDIIDSFFSGLTDAWKSVQEFVGGIGDWIAENKGPKEYDLRLLTPNAKWIMQGFAKGLRDSFYLVEDAVSDMSNIEMQGPTITAGYATAESKSALPPVYLTVNYNGQEDGGTIVDDMVSQLKLYGYTMGVE